MRGAVIGIDTNVLVRFLVRDDPEQAKIATRFFADLTLDRMGFIPREVVLETVWVLERAYKEPRSNIARAINGLLEAEELVVEQADEIGRATDRYRKGGAGFADHVIACVAASAGCETVVTFDKQAAKLNGMSAIT